MIRKTVIALVLCIIAGFQTVMAGNKIETKSKKMYFFGVARNYADSTACLTDITPIDGVAIDKHTDGVANIELYTEQYSNFLKQRGKFGYICATFYSDKYKDIEKIFLKQRKRLERNKGLKLDFVTNEDFKFNFVDSKQIYRNSVESAPQGEENAE